MSLITLLSSIAAISALTGLDNIIMMDGENNYYDDSDFYYVGFNASTGQYFKHYHSTTRAGGFRSMPNAVLLSSLSTAAQEEAGQYFKNACLAEAERLMNEEYSYVLSVGDTVNVSNTRVRKHKGETFTVLDKSTYKDMYGRTQTVYLHGANDAGDIKTAHVNCTRVALGNEVLQDVAERLALGLAIKF